MDIFGFDIAHMVFWHWLILGVGFLILEVLTMGFFFLWFGLAGLVVGAVLYLMPDMGWEAQFGIWGFLSVATAFGWRVYKKKNPNVIRSDEPNLNKRGHQYVGRTFTLSDAITNGSGKIKVDDTIWKAEASEDIKAGQKVKVIDVEGTVLIVEKA